MKAGLMQKIILNQPTAVTRLRWPGAAQKRPVLRHSGPMMPGVEGLLKRTVVRDGMAVTACDFTTTTALEGSMHGHPSLSVAVFLKAGGVTGVADGPVMPYRDGYLYVFLSNRRAWGRFQVPAGQRMAMAELRIDWDVLCGMFDPAVFTSTMADELDMYAEDLDGVWMGCAPAPREMILATERLLTGTVAQEAAGGRADALFVEGKALELLALALDRLTAAQARPPRPPEPHRLDRRRVQAAHDLMMGDIAHGWTIAELARAAGLNEKKLKHGFRALYNASVHQYLQDVRMRRAGDLLRRPAASVTEVSLTVGYANPSHFAKLFRRYYGVAPSAYTAASPR